MKSNEVLKETFKEKGVKFVAQELGVSSSLVYKWCHDKESETSPGAENPLDRLQNIITCTENKLPVQWLCQANGGFFVSNPAANSQVSGSVLGATQRLLSEFSELLAAVSESYQDDGVIDPTEAKKIRKEWEDLKTLAEQFVLACEDGAYTQS